MLVQNERENQKGTFEREVEVIVELEVERRGQRAEPHITCTSPVSICTRVHCGGVAVVFPQKTTGFVVTSHDTLWCSKPCSTLAQEYF